MIFSGQLSILVYSDASASNNPQKRLADIKEVLSDSSVNQWETLHLQVATAVVDQVVALNGITADKFYLKSDQNISIKLNTSTVALAGTLFYMECAVSAIKISNASGQTANIEICLGS